MNGQRSYHTTISCMHWAFWVLGGHYDYFCFCRFFDSPLSRPLSSLAIHAFGRSRKANMGDGVHCMLLSADKLAARGLDGVL
jgi:hypothetical protein